MKKNEKKVTKKSSNTTIVSKEEKMMVKVIFMIATFFATVLSLIIFVFGIITTTAIINGQASELANNNTVMTFITRMNGYTISEAQHSINIMDSKFLYIAFEVIVPSMALICAMLLLIYLSVRIMNFVEGISKEKDLYTTDKYMDAKDIFCILSVIIFISFLIFNKPSFIFFMLIELLICFVIILYKKVVSVIK